MEPCKSKKKMSLIKKTWERCRSLGSHHHRQEYYRSSSSSILSPDLPVFSKSKSWGAFPIEAYYEDDQFPYYEHDDDIIHIVDQSSPGGGGGSGVGVNDGSHSTSSRLSSLSKRRRYASKSSLSISTTWPRTPEGCFSVYVGQNRERFVVKAEIANHPLFLLLLEEAATEYGFNCKGPILLPCSVEDFVKVAKEIDGDEFEELMGQNQNKCSPCKSPISYSRLLSPSSARSSGRGS